MAAYHDWTPGEIVTATNLDIYTNNLKAMCQLSRTTVSIGDGVQTTISFNSIGHVDLDPRNWHDTATNPERITPDLAGWYRLVGNYTSVVSTAYTRLNCVPLKNGLGIAGVRADLAWTGATESVTPGIGFSSKLVQANGTTDYFGISVYQNSDGSKDGDVSLLVQLVYPT